MNAQEFLLKVKAAYENFRNSIPTENVAVVANEENNGDVIEKESNMDETLQVQECGTPSAAAEPTQLEAEAAKDKEPQMPEAKKEDKPEDKKEEGKEEKKEDKGLDVEKKPESDKKKEIKESDFKKAEDLIKKVLKNEEAEAAAGEEESEDIKDLKEAAKALGMKVEDKKEEAPELGAPADLPMPEVPEMPKEIDTKVEVDEEKPEGDFNPFASLTATFQKKATVADSVWLIKNASDNSDYLSFNVKAAFGAGIDKDSARSAYAQSDEFGKAVIAALINEKVSSAVGAKAAVLGVVAHYNPSYASAKQYADFPAANPGANGAKVEEETDKNLVSAKEVKASATAPIAKKAADEAAKTESLATDATILPDAVKVSEDENTKQDKSAVAYQGPKIPAEGDRKVIASMEETIKKQADEINALKLQAAINEKTAKVKEAVNLMVRAGLIKSNEQVRIAALKEGLSIEAAAAKGMAASIETQSKNLFGMNTPQLDSYIKSLAELAPRAKAVQASTNQPLTVKASVAETEEQRLAKLLGWD